MLKLSHSKLIAISGLLWLCVGMSLLPLGINLLVKSDIRPLALFASPYFGGLEEATVALIAIALFIGYMKGRFVFGKSSKRIVERVRSAPNPSGLSTVFTPAYCVLIGCMMALGMGIKYLGIPNDVRGMVDVAVGAAMINGSTITLRYL